MQLAHYRMIKVQDMTHMNSLKYIYTVSINHKLIMRLRNKRKLPKYETYLNILIKVDNARVFLYCIVCVYMKKQ